MIKETIELKAQSQPYWHQQVSEIVKKLNPALNYRVYFSDRKPTRSNSQNRYLWGVVYKTISEYTGYDTDNVHAIFTDKFLDKKVIAFGDTELVRPKSTTELTKEEFSDYIERLTAWASENEIPIPSAKAIPDHIYIQALEHGGR